MLDFKPVAGEDALVVPLYGRYLLEHPIFNKGTAFTEEERIDFRLLGMLPPHVDTLDEQAARAYEQYRAKDNDLERHIFLRALQDQNEVLFYRLMADHVTEMMPVVYTPTVGDCCRFFSLILRKPRGLFISYPEREHIETILESRPFRQVDVIVVTDGERILGLGDQGAGGMGIPVGKLALYTLLGGIHPACCLPVLLDVGTENPDRLADPLYVGWRHHRIRGAEYDDFVDRFVQAVKRQLPHVLLQWEDFAQANAGRLLARYRDQLCTFNDDIQGTAAVVLATLLAAMPLSGRRLRDQDIAIVGAGSAGCGIAGQLVAALIQEGLSEADARGRLWLVDRAGLLHDQLPGLLDAQRPFAQPRERLAGWVREQPDRVGLAEVVSNIHPGVLVGVSAQPGLFTEAIIRDLARHTARPIILPLSNPPSRCEAVPADLVAWTEGRGLIATGSPFPPVTWQGRRFPIAQCNNAYIFPAVGLGALAARARRVTDAMFTAAARALADCSPARRDPGRELLPPLEGLRDVVRDIALAVAGQAQRDGVAGPLFAAELERRVAANFWSPHYPRYVRAGKRVPPCRVA